ncbi:DWNN-domain-containing protein [Metschnikowia bicuspidata var. bicuspidata NRRL YB-4993]|uniref:DWNN-domain-containing protein n=1 Tax=Metschnikowia bicuspidata var. bicuspidata NRRL YB-4993 TaxID=869754 RepID=A0A1A0HFZ8_9ASCO|nr:DWNN-domain-containing protein [Metschnikowia bicuspidata var. bicuspidata NRRL YB-4993]OBA22926.1 DWNN-domain-containing protein [Metschnikowia bicuspidata var. bicuspidata NRRL YB-4993]
MSSTIFYRFVHQKNQSTVYFDGTGINVFDLKHEIILQNLLGQGLDFMLRLFHLEQPDVEYENDQDVIPRSTFVLAKRSPISVFNGRSQSAARYVSGRPRVTKFKPQAAATQKAPLVQPEAGVNENISEEDRIRLMFENQSNVWAQAQDELSQHKVVHYKSGAEDLPPPGYVCYRCGGKDHWIKNCPTNSDPNFEGKKIKKTTGIPKSYMKTISKETVEYRLQNPESNESGIHTDENGDLVDAQGNTYMITEDGDYVMTFADSKTWALYQEKQQSAALKAQRQFEQDVTNRILADNRTEFLNPLSSEPKVLKSPIRMTACCQDAGALQKMKNYNYNQIELEQELIENDFHCPNCCQEDVFIDSLIPNDTFEKELSDYVGLLGLQDPTAIKRTSSEALGDANIDSKRRDITNTTMPAPTMPFPMMPMMPVPNMFMPTAGSNFSLNLESRQSK